MENKAGEESIKKLLEGTGKAGADSVLRARLKF